jgi:hypothetical protein
MAPEVVARVGEFGAAPLASFLDRYALTLVELPPSSAIPGSYWGETEAGLVADRLYVRPDTPVHSVLHEAAHFVCMDATRRSRLAQDAGGDDAEENAVCYLQLAWAAELPGFSRERMFGDMDAWGYSFRLGSARRWFEEDADDARRWLERFGLIDAAGRTTGRRRE